MKGITLKQTKDGKWRAGGRALLYHAVVIEEETPNAALESAAQFLDLYELFVDHLYGTCNQETCENCKEDKKQNRKARGLGTGKRPKRWNETAKKKGAA